MNPPNEPETVAPTSTAEAAADGQFPVEHRFELTREYHATPEQLWSAIATGDGISAWMMPTTMEPREGGAVRFEMGENAASEGFVTVFDEPHRIAYVEPEWALLVGRERDCVAPLATEFLIEARSGGTCILRVVSSAFGTGADWEGEFFGDMEKGWVMMFDNLRLYLEHFDGQRAATVQVDLPVEAASATTFLRLREALGGPSVGDCVAVQDLRGTVVRLNSAPEPNEVVIQTTAPFGGIVAFMVWGGDESCVAMLSARYFGDGAEAAIEAQRRDWTEWLRATMTAA